MIKKIIVTFFFISFFNLANAAIVEIIVSEVGGIITLTGSGSIDLTGIDLDEVAATTPTNRAEATLFGGTISSPLNSYRPVINPIVPLATNSRTGNPKFVSFDVSPSSDNFYVQSNLTNPGFIRLNEGYQSLDPINFIWTVTNSTTFEEFNIGKITSFGNNTIIMTDASIIPIPAAAWLFGSALLGFAGIAKRKYS